MDEESADRRAAGGQKGVGAELGSDASFPARLAKAKAEVAIKALDAEIEKGDEMCRKLIDDMEAVQGRDDIMFQMVGKEGAAEADRAEGNDERSRNLALAEDSEKAGVDARAVKLATGWERGADGQWRYEIPDADVDILSNTRPRQMR